MKALNTIALLTLITMLLASLTNGTITAQENPPEPLPVQDMSAPLTSSEAETDTLPSSYVQELQHTSPSAASSAGLPCRSLPFVYTAERPVRNFWTTPSEWLLSNRRSGKVSSDCDRTAKPSHTELVREPG